MTPADAALVLSLLHEKRGDPDEWTSDERRAVSAFHAFRADTPAPRRVHAYTGPTDYHVIEVLRVVDGDTIDLRVDLGFHLHALERFRLVEVNTPERSEPGWAEATAYVRAWLDAALAEGHELRVRTHKAGAFGRWLGDVYAVNDAGSERRLVDDLLEDGHAVPYVR